MAKDCYLEIDGKRTKLTDEQLKALGLYEEPKKANSFERVRENEKFYFIDDCGIIGASTDCRGVFQNNVFDVANYCTDIELMQQRALHETLNRLLWRFSMENEGNKIDWENGKFDKWYIYYENRTEIMRTSDNCYQKNEGAIYFYTREIAQRAINEIIKPFMKNNPKFVW